jgi:precorrin-6A/cobalt-precorrin-6A reductase
MIKNLWLIGGTSDSTAIALALKSYSSELIITVTTESARSLYPAEFRVIAGCLDKSQMSVFCREHQIGAIVDASHPHAAEVSQNAFSTAKLLNIPYLRYERPLVEYPTSDRVTVLDSLEAAIAEKYLLGQRVLLTVGCKALPLFKSWHERSQLWARILPKPESLEMALAAGFTSNRLICLRPPISMELEAALWRQWQISLVITKASGKAGGEDLKIQVAEQLNIPLIIISRPKICHQLQTSCINKVVAFVRGCLCRSTAELVPRSGG